MDAPCLFLSHSGAQKDFARRLYYELVHVGHSAFFDEDALDSLPKGRPFPPGIMQACRGCRIGIVVLSDQYLESLWPMLELEQLTFHNPSSTCILYPLFYSIPPGDLSNEEKLRQWQATWDSKALEWQSKVEKIQATYASTPSTSHLEISIKISSWPEALERLRNQSGDVFRPLEMDERAYIKMVVSNICKAIPPPRAAYLPDDHIKGTGRLQEEIDRHFRVALRKSANSTSASCLGVWGLGGSGKTTLCMNMANFYRGYFPGRSLFLALPTDEKDEKQLVKAIKEVILALGRVEKDKIKTISSVEMIMRHLEDGLRGCEVFLALDNVSNWTIQRAKQIASMACKVVGSKILVTSRSKQILELLLPAGSCWIVPVPGITEDEAVEVLKCSSFGLPAEIPELDLDLKGLAQLCFFEGQCHPLLLKTMGEKLRRRVGRMNHVQGLKNIISRLQTRPMDDVENTVMDVLERSFRALTLQLQKTFIDLVTCTPAWSNYENPFIRQCRWLSMIHDGLTRMDMRDQLIELEYHGLLEIKKEISILLGYEQIRQSISIHDLHKNVARRAAGGRDACFFEGRLSGLSIDRCRNTKLYAHIISRSDDNMSDLMSVFTDCSKLEILVIESLSSLDSRIISVQNMQYLRFLELNRTKFLEEIEGWEGTPNLVSLKLRDCESLQNLGDMGCLRELKKLIISGCPDCAVPSLGQKPKLQTLKLNGNKNLKDARAFCTFTALRRLDLAGCKNLDQLMDGMVCPLTALEKLDLDGCPRLKRIPDLSNLERLKVVRGAYYLLPKLIGGSAATSLQGLCLQRLDIDAAGIDARGPISYLGAFVKLRDLTISCGYRFTNYSLDVSGLTNLERCHLESFLDLEEITGADALPKLKHLYILNCLSLKRFLAGGSGVEALVSASTVHDDDASKQTLYMKALDVGHSSAITAQVSGPVFPTCLEELCIRRCHSLTTLPPLPSAAALRSLSLDSNESLTDVSSLTTPLPFLQRLCLKSCHSLRELPNLTHLTSLQKVELHRSLNTLAVRNKFHKKVDVSFPKY